MFTKEDVQDMNQVSKDLKSWTKTVRLLLHLLLPACWQDRRWKKKKRQWFKKEV